MLPDKTLAFKKDDEHKKEGFKSIKERVTLLFAVNKTGSHKLKPLCIVKSHQPICFNHINMKTLPFVYTNSNKAWMTSDIFMDWFLNHFVPEVRRNVRSLKLPETALLLLDNCPAHPPAETLKTRTKHGKIRIDYLPKNTTSLIQPLDQGIIANFKKHYRRELVNNMIVSEMPVTDYLQGLTLKDFIYTGPTAWSKITPSTIEGSWMRGLSMAFPSNKDMKDVAAVDDIRNNASDDDDGFFVGFGAEDLADINKRQLECFQRALASDGIDVSQQDINKWFDIEEAVQTNAVDTEDSILESAIKPLIPGETGEW